MTKTITVEVPHPGEYIREEIETRGWNQRDLAFILGCPPQAVTMILTGKRGISADMTKALGDAFGVPAELFVNLQRAYDLAHANDPDPNISVRAKMQEQYPVREMIKRGWLTTSDNAPSLDKQLADFFEVTGIDQIPYLRNRRQDSPSSKPET